MKKICNYLMTGLLLIYVFSMSFIIGSADSTDYSLILNCNVITDNTETAIVGDEFAVVKVAYCTINDNPDSPIVDYQTVERFEEYDCSWAELTSSGMRMKANEIAQNVTYRDYIGTEKTDINGTSAFKLEAPGLYLVVRSEASDETITFEPLLISVPQIINGTINNNVISAPKFEITKSESDDLPTVDTDSEPLTNSDAIKTTTNIDYLPQTGQMNLLVVFFFVVGIIIMILGLFIMRQEKNNEKR